MSSTGCVGNLPPVFSSPAWEALLPCLPWFMKEALVDLELLLGSSVGDGVGEYVSVGERSSMLCDGPDSVSDGISKTSSGVLLGVFKVGDAM